jgi:hypothetical protein
MSPTLPQHQTPYTNPPLPQYMPINTTTTVPQYQAIQTYTQATPIYQSLPYQYNNSYQPQHTTYWPGPNPVWPEQNPYQTNFTQSNNYNNQQTTHHDNSFAQAFSKALKIEFPKFDGENPMGWLRQVEKCFTLAETPMDKRVKFAEVFFIGKADHWLRSSGINTNSISWAEFAVLISNRFTAETSFELIDSFRHIEQTSSVLIYIDSFEELMGKLKMQNPTLTEDYFIGCFLSGLKDHIKIPIRSRAPRSLVQAYSLARNYEAAAPRKSAPDSSRWSSKPHYVGKVTNNVVKKEITDDKQHTGNRWKKGKCFKCQEPWVPGHNRVCKFRNQIHLISIEDADGSDKETEEQGDDNVVADNDDNLELVISMHALPGTSSKARTFPLFLQLGSVKALALIDSGSTTTFLDPSIVDKVGLSIQNHDPVKVTVANGTILYTQAVCKNCPYKIQGHEFVSDCRILELAGYDMILGCDWIYDYSPVGINLKTREFTVEKDGTKVCFQDETLPNANFLVSHKKMKIMLKKGVVGVVIYVQKVQMDKHSNTIPQLTGLLQQYEDIFQEPKELPPPRDVDHQIPLQNAGEIVNSRPYRLSFSQKNTMEALILELLKNKLIQPSAIPYSSPAILVKKKDDTWRLCIDYRKLNKITVKNEYPIPIIEDLQDELNGAKIFSKIDLRYGYHQIRMHVSDIPKTTFCTYQGHFEYVVMPFGFTNASATFQTLMNQLLQRYLRKFVLVFFDDILIYSKNEAERMEHLKVVLELLKKNKLFVKKSKCVFGQNQVE